MPLNPGADLRCDAKKHKREEEAQTGHKAKLAASKDTVKKVKTQVTEWEEMCANHFSGKGPESKKYIKSS